MKRLVVLTVQQAPTVNSVEISGVTSVNESSTSNYTLILNCSDGSNQAITSGVSWSDNSSFASISASGVLTTDAVDSDQTITITAGYGGQSETHTVTIKNRIESTERFNNGHLAEHQFDINVAPLTLKSVAISGEGSLNENSSSGYTLTASYTDGTSQAVTGVASWSVTSSFVSIDSNGVLTAALSVASDQAVSITASYGGAERYLRGHHQRWGRYRRQVMPWR